MLKFLLRLVAMFGLLLNIATVNAEDLLGYLTDKDGKYAGPTVEDNIAAMDADKNGFADVTEVRAFLVLKNGADYQKEILDRWQLRSQGKSCTLPPDDKLFN
jgi:purine nucleoside permease